MWFGAALVLLVPLWWALLGAQPVPRLQDLLGSAPDWLLEPVTVATGPLVAASAIGVVLGIGRARSATTHLSTLAHEFGHGLTAALLGGRVSRITLSRDGSGIAYSSFPGRRPVRRFAVSFAGYVAPGIVGVACLRVALAGYGALWVGYIAAALAVLLVLTVRSWWGALVAVGCALGCAALLASESGWAAGVAVAGLGGALVAGGVIDSWAQWHACRSPSGTDADSMAEQTRLPARLFAGIHVLACLGLAAYGAALVLGF